MRNLLIIFAIFGLFSCSSKSRYEPVPADEAPSSYNSVQEPNADKRLTTSVDKIEKKVIRTAETRFKVKNVKKATHDIEDITAHYDGFIQTSEMSSYIQRTEYTKISKDSLMEVLEVRLTNHLVVRIPIEKFDTVLNKLEKLHVFLDYKRINDDDVSLNYFSNKLKLKSREEVRKRIKDAINKGGKLNDVIDAEQTAANMEEESINNKINNLSIDAQVRFSTIGIFIYEPNFVFKNVVPNNSVDSYSPSFWSKMGDALAFGWKALLEIIIGIAHIWFLLVIGGVVFGIIWYVRRKKKKE